MLQILVITSDNILIRSFAFISGIVLIFILISNSVFAIPIEEVAEYADDFGRSLTSGDFNGDGFDDLAIGVPYEDIGSIQDAGAVNVIYGSQGAGLTATGNQLWHQNSPGILDVAEAGEYFGSSLTSGDFNGDGFDDLAIGAPDQRIGNILYAGIVHVIYGSQGKGLTAAGNQIWYQGAGILDDAEQYDFFGASLGSGDFNDDGFDDLAIGVPYEDIGSIQDAGAVNVIYGTQGKGLAQAFNQFWDQASPGILDVPEPYDYFGYSFASDDFTKDGVDDLAIGARNEGIKTIDDAAGAVHTINGSQGVGLISGGNQLWYQHSPVGILGNPEVEDAFGHSLAAGDFDKNGFNDLAIGARGDHTENIIGAGAVNVIYGRSQGAGLTATGNQLWHQASPGILGDPEEYDDFGTSLASGDFDGDGFDDLAAGVFADNIPNVDLAGAVNVIYGSQGAGLTQVDNQLWHQNSPGILDDAEESDYLGGSLASGDFDGDGFDDLAIGVTGEGIGNIHSAGIVHVIYGSQGVGLTKVDNQIWHQNS